MDWALGSLISMIPHLQEGVLSCHEDIMVRNIVKVPYIWVFLLGVNNSLMGKGFLYDCS